MFILTVLYSVSVGLHGVHPRLTGRRPEAGRMRSRRLLSKGSFQAQKVLGAQEMPDLEEIQEAILRPQQGPALVCLVQRL